MNLSNIFPAILASGRCTLAPGGATWRAVAGGAGWRVFTNVEPCLGVDNGPENRI